MFWVYILKSLKNGRYYIEHTNNLHRRLTDHNRGKNHSSKCGKPWIMVYNKSFPTLKEAVRHEKYLKSLKSRKQLEKIINVAG